MPGGPHMAAPKDGIFTTLHSQQYVYLTSNPCLFLCLPPPHTGIVPLTHHPVREQFLAYFLPEFEIIQLIPIVACS